MIKTSTQFLGLSLRNPLVAGSSGFTSSVSTLKKLEKAGVGAVVLKSLFEEQIRNDINEAITLSGDSAGYPEAEDYIRAYTKQNSVNDYIQLIRSAKEELDIPVIASINCISSEHWIDFVKQIVKAGADALEVNMYDLPTDPNQSADDIEKKYLSRVSKISGAIKIPFSVKISSNFTSILRMVDQITAHGASAVTMFNKYYTPDFNLDNLTIGASDAISAPSDLYRNLRWTGIVKGKLPKTEIAASGGILDSDAVIKQLLAGAQVVELCSILYKDGEKVVSTILDDLNTFMEKWSYESVEAFRGRLCYNDIDSAAMYERAQFMKYFSSRD